MEHLSLVISQRGYGPRHRTGTPGLTPYRSWTIDAARPPSGKPRHLRRTVRISGAQVALAVAGAAVLALAALGGYRAAEGAAIVLSMF